MKILATLVSIFAMHLLSDDWKNLQKQLRYQYAKYRSEKYYLHTQELRRLLILGEDHRFFWHGGFDIIAICRVVWRRLLWGIIEGGSTIEQQLVRVLTNKYERTLKRKLKEILLATLISKIIPKNDIPAVYLQVAYFGWGMNGFQQACARLRLIPKTISLFDAATLIACIKYPAPKMIPKNRGRQIYNRHNHLISLHHKYSKKGVYISIKRKVIYGTF